MYILCLTLLISALIFNSHTLHIITVVFGIIDFITYVIVKITDKEFNFVPYALIASFTIFIGILKVCHAF